MPVTYTSYNSIAKKYCNKLSDGNIKNSITSLGALEGKSPQGFSSA